MAKQVVDNLGKTITSKAWRHQNGCIVDGVFWLTTDKAHLYLFLVHVHSWKEEEKFGCLFGLTPAVLSANQLFHAAQVSLYYIAFIPIVTHTSQVVFFYTYLVCSDASLCYEKSLYWSFSTSIPLSETISPTHNPDDLLYVCPSLWSLSYIQKATTAPYVSSCE